MRRVTGYSAFFLVVSLLVAGSTPSLAATIVDDFAAPQNVLVPVITLLNPDPTLLKTADAGILGGERDLLLDVMGTAGFSSFIGEVGAGYLSANGSTPGTAITLQYDGLDADSQSPTGLVNAEGLGGTNLAAVGSQFELAFGSVDGGASQSTGLVIEVHSSSAVASFAGQIPDSASAASYYAPFASFSDPSVFTDVTSIEVRLNPRGSADTDFQLDLIRVVPEPSTLAMLGALGALATAALVWRRK